MIHDVSDPTKSMYVKYVFILEYIYDDMYVRYVTIHRVYEHTYFIY